MNALFEILLLISPTEYFVTTFGILFFWFLKYSKEKDPYDDADVKFSMLKWIRLWLGKRNDNIIIHFMCSYFFLFMGSTNLEAWLGDFLTIPENLNEVGVSGFIGFSGSYIAEFLKKGVKAEKFDPEMFKKN